MLIKTLLNRMEKFKSLGFSKAWIEESLGKEPLFVEIQLRKNSRRKRPTYDTQKIREFEYIPLWIFHVVLRLPPGGWIVLGMESRPSGSLGLTERNA